MKIKWNEKRIEDLKKCYPCEEWENIFKIIGSQNKEAIENKASKLKIKREYLKAKVENPLIKNRVQFTKEEDLFIIEKYSNLNAREIAEILNRKPLSIINRLRKLQIKKVAWEELDIEILKNVYPIYPNKYIQEKYFPNKSIPVIIKKASKEGLSKTQEKGREWYPREHSLQKLKDFAQKLGRTPTCADIDANSNLPSSKTFERYFGSVSKATIACGLVPTGTMYTRGISAVSSNGEKCDSNAEYIITEYLIKNNVEYEKTARYSDYINDSRCNTKTCDWVINSIFVEYFGLPENPQYYKKMEEKRKILEDNNFQLIELFKKDLNKLDQKLGTLSQ